MMYWLSILTLKFMLLSSYIYCYGRGYMNAPDVDGSVIIHNESMQKIKPGSVVKCKIIKRNNIDLEAIPV